MTVVDLRLPDRPLIYVNPAFERVVRLPGRRGPTAPAPSSSTSGIQTDVSARVEAERSLATEQDRRRGCQDRIAQLQLRGHLPQSATDSPGARRA